MQSKGSTPGPDDGTSVDPNSTIGKTSQPALDPHHIELVQVGKRVKVNKYDKHPNIKKRRDYREMLSLECTLECIKKEHEKYYDPGMNLDAKESSRPSSRASKNNKKGGSLLMNS